MKNACPTKVGGQAILEGLMMRGSRALAIAIRQPDGDIHLTVEPLKKAGGWKKIPVVRGVGSFVSSLVTGTSVLMYGADVLERLEAAACQEERLKIASEEVVGEMAACRKIIDRLERITPEAFWPYPSYTQLLFAI